MGGSSTIEGGRRVLVERGSSTDGSSGTIFRFVSYSCFYISSNRFCPVLSVKPVDYCFISASPDAHETTLQQVLNRFTSSDYRSRASRLRSGTNQDCLSPALLPPFFGQTRFYGCDAHPQILCPSHYSLRIYSFSI